MALPLHALERLAPHFKGAHVLCLGYPDLMVRAEELKARFGVTATAFTNRGPAHQVKFPLPETREAFKALGVVAVDFVDVVKSTGFEEIADLNQPQDFGKYDLVIDPGTLEHCFNIGQAIFNAANAVKVGGRIFHISPMNMMNHGFYNICPTMMHDFYTQNGWGLEALETVNERAMDFLATQRFHAVIEFNLVTMAQRKHDGALRYPVQSKYRKGIEAAANREAA